MKKITSSVIGLLLCVQAHSMTQSEQSYLTIGSVTVQEVPDLSPLPDKMTTTTLFNNLQGDPDLVSQLKNGVSQVSKLSKINEIDAELDMIINIGKKVWKIIEDGKPVVNAQLNSASAMPDGVLNWKQLSGWKSPRSASYRVNYKNLFGMTVVDFTYRVLFSYGGQLNGSGKYVTGATIMPAGLDVAWGYSFSSSVEIPTVLNIGSVESPVGGIQMNINWLVGTVLKHSETRSSFFVDGLGNLKILE